MNTYGNGNDGKYGCEVRIFDAKGSGSTIGWQPHTNCSTAKPLTVDSKLSNPLVIAPEAKGASTDSGLSQTKCTVGTWDASDDPEVCDVSSVYPWSRENCAVLITCSSIAKWIVVSNVLIPGVIARMVRVKTWCIWTEHFQVFLPNFTTK